MANWASFSRSKRTFSPEPAELIAAMATANREFLMERAIADADFDPRADGVAVRAVLLDLERYPVPHLRRFGHITQTEVSPQPDVLAAIHLDDVEHPVEIEVGDAGTPCS